MKRVLLLGFTFAMSIGSAFSQLVVDNFETYTDSAQLKAVWKESGNLPGEDALLIVGGGANSTSNYMKLTDGGFSVVRRAPDIFIPPAAGTYKLSFYYKNALDGELPWNNLTVVLGQDGSNKVNTLFAPNSAVAEWTLFESGPFALSAGTSVTLEFTGSNGVEATYSAGIDEIKLTEIIGSPPVVTTNPDQRVYLSGTRTIAANVVLGSGSYTQVTFDVGDNGSVEFTDTAAPYEFVWNTTTVMPNTSGTVPLKVTATDTNAMNGSVVVNFVVDNEYGRQLIVDSNFSTFQGSGFGANAPVGWVPNQAVANATFGPGTDRNSVANQALRVNFAASDFTNRYTLRSDGDLGAYYDLQTIWWGRGTSCRLYYFKSSDNVTFATTSIDAGQVNNANWTFVIDPPVKLGLLPTEYISVATHQFNAGDHFYDDVKVEANKPTPPAKVEGWNLY